MARKINLREFQDRVFARLKSVPANASESSRLGLVIGQEYWLVNLRDVSEVMPAPNIVAVPLVRRWFRGVTNIRGNLYSVVDMPAYLGAEPTTMNQFSRLLLVHPRHILSSSLLVNRMMGLRSLETLTLEVAGSGPYPWVSNQYRDPEGRLWLELDMRVLVESPAFFHVTAE